MKESTYLTLLAAIYIAPNVHPPFAMVIGLIFAGWSLYISWRVEK